MNTTTNTAVENKGNIFSSFINSYWKTGYRFSTVLTAMIMVIFIGIIYYGPRQSFYQIIIACIATSANTSTGISTIVGILIGSVSGTVILITGEYLWAKNRKYFLPFVLLFITIFSWFIFSNQLTTTKVGDIEMEMYSYETGKLAEKSVFIPLFFSSMDEEYITVVKLAPRKITVKVTIPDDPKAKWRGELKLNDTIFVELQPLNYEARKKIMESGLWQIETKTTSKADAPEAIKIDVLKQLSLEPSDVNIKVSEI